MRRAVLLLSLLVAASAAATGQARSATGCGVKQVGGVTVRTWCGPAKAAASVGGKKIAIKGGSCSVTKVSGIALFAITVGRYTVPPGKPKFASVSASGSDLKPGTYRYWVINFQTPGKQWTLKPTTTRVTITKGARRGTFVGTTYEGGKKAKGSWTC